MGAWCRWAQQPPMTPRGHLNPRGRGGSPRCDNEQ